MRAFFPVLCLLACLLDVPATAQDAKAETGPTLGEQIHRALGGDGTEPAAIGALLRDAINNQGGICLNVQSYQIFRRTADTDTLKIECSDRPLYLLSIDDKAHMILSGGDSRVQAMDRDDGDVILTGNTTAPSTAAKSKTKDLFKLPGQTNDAIPDSALPQDKRPKLVTVDQTDPRGWTRWVFSGLLATFGLVAFLGYSQLAHRARFKQGVDRVGLYNSEDKDRMVAESAELKPDFYIHPSGLFIVRGKRGKRRLFPNRFYAYLYWRYGLKVAQIR